MPVDCRMSGYNALYHMPEWRVRLRRGQRLRGRQRGDNVCFVYVRSDRMCLGLEVCTVRQCIPMSAGRLQLSERNVSLFTYHM